MLARSVSHPLVQLTRLRHHLAARAAARHAPTLLGDSAMGALRQAMGPTEIPAPEAARARALEQSGGIQAHLARFGLTSWADLAVQLRAAASYEAAAAIAGPVLASVPRVRHLWLLAHAPAPLPQTLLEQLQVERPGLLTRTSQARVGGGLLVSAPEVHAALAAGMSGSVTPSRRARLDLVHGLAYRVPSQEWTALLCLPQRAVLHLLDTSLAQTIRAMREGNARAYAALCDTPDATVAHLVARNARLRLGGGVQDPGWQVARRAWTAPEAWTQLCAERPQDAVQLLALWAEAAPAWWTPAMAAPILASGSREQRLAVTALLSRLRRAPSTTPVPERPVLEARPGPGPGAILSGALAEQRRRTPRP